LVVEESVLQIPGKYAKLPMIILQRSDVSPQAKILWAVLAHNQAEPEGFVTLGGKPMKHADLMEACGMPRRTLQHGLEELGRLGLLRIVRHDRKGKTTLLRVLVPGADHATRAAPAQVPGETCAAPAQVPAPLRRKTCAAPAQDLRRSGARTSMTKDSTGRGQPAPAPVAPCIESTTKGEWPVLLAQAYLARTIRQVTFADAAASITDHLRNGLSESLLAAYLDATPHVRAWPSELADRTWAWSEAERLKAFRAELIRIRQGGLVVALRATADGGEEVGRVRFVDPEADPPRLVIEIDHTPAALSREAQIASLREDLAKMPATMHRSAYERGRRAELESLERGGEPVRPERRVERVDVRTSEALVAWVFRPADATLPGLDDGAAREAIVSAGEGATAGEEASCA